MERTPDQINVKLLVGYDDIVGIGNDHDGDSYVD